MEAPGTDRLKTDRPRARTARTAAALETGPLETSALANGRPTDAAAGGRWARHGSRSMGSFEVMLVASNDPQYTDIPDRTARPAHRTGPGARLGRARLRGMSSRQAAGPLEIFSWAMFDFANSSYTTVIVTVAFGVFFTSSVAPPESADFLWGLALGISNVLVLVTAPLIGAAADDSGRKKPFLAATYLSCVAATAALYFVEPGSVVIAMALFVLSNVAFAHGENLVGAFLPEISTADNAGRISGLGWGLGYFGGLASLLLIRPFMAAGLDAGNLDRVRWIWPLTAGFFLIAALPTFAWLRERAPRDAWRGFPAYARRGFARLLTTGHSIAHFRQLARFLTVFFVYSLGFTIAVAFSGIFARTTLGFTANELVALFLILQLSSAAGAVGFGWLQDKIGSRRTLQLSLALWVAGQPGLRRLSDQVAVPRDRPRRRHRHRLAAGGVARRRRHLLAAQQGRGVLRLLGTGATSFLRAGPHPLRPRLLVERLPEDRHPDDHRLLPRRPLRPPESRRRGRSRSGAQLARARDLTCTLAWQLGLGQLAIAAVPVDERRLVFVGRGAGLHFAHVDRVGAGRVAGVDRAIEPGERVLEHGRAGRRGRPVAAGKAVFGLDPGEAVRQLLPGPRGGC